MGNLKINVKNKIAESINECIVCGNSDYIIEFAFDDEWQAHKVKTARFIFNNTAVDIVFEGNTVAVPVITNTTTLAVGVFAGNLCTTTPALISCSKSILCEQGLPPDPAPDVYAQIIELLNKGGSGGNGTNGKDGVSPTVEVTETENGHRVNITDVDGEHIFEVTNGVDGKDGYTPQKGVDYFDGKDGENGKDGKDGEKGDPFTYEDFTAEQLAALKGKDGVDGKDGQDGADGKDYVLTEADKIEIAEQAAALIDTSLSAAIGSGVLV